MEAELRPVKALPSPVTAGMSCHEAFGALVRGCLTHLLANQRGMLESSDPEYLHQMRVALRRLRSVCATFKTLFPAGALAPLIEEARWLAQMLGPARDWDVFNAETLPPLSARYPGHAGIAALAHSAARLSLGAKRRARRAVTCARGQGLLRALGEVSHAEQGLAALDAEQCAVLARPVTDFARAVLDAALQRVAKRGRHLGELTPRELHRLRIAAKKLRYAVECFAPLYDDARAGVYRAALVRLQDALGSYNDAVTVKQLAMRASRGLHGATAGEAFDIMLNWSAGMRETGAHKLQRVWQKFCTAKAFWE